MLSDLVISLAASAIGGVLVFAWHSVIYPFLIERFKEPTKLAPEYYGTLDFGHGPTHRISVTVRKLGYRVTGLIRFTEGEHQGKEYELEGRYSHGSLTFTYWALNKASTSQGAGTFQRRHDGQLFVGAFAYYSQGQDAVSTVACALAPAGATYSSEARN